MPPEDPSRGPEDKAPRSRWPWPLSWFLALPTDSTLRTMITAVGLCFVCSIFVSAAAVSLRPIQESNQRLDKQRNILQVAGLMREDASIEELFQSIEARAVDLRTGRFTDAVDPASFDQTIAARDPALSTALADAADLAGIGRRAHYATVYLVRDDAGAVRKVILPVHGYGLWSTLYGFLALQPDGNTIIGLQFYDHAETPGLGGEVDNPKWRAQWQGKKLFDAEGALQVAVAKGDTSANPYAVDALSGATLTSRGVQNLLRYWVSADGFGPFLSNLSQELTTHG